MSKKFKRLSDLIEYINDGIDSAHKACQEVSIYSNKKNFPKLKNTYEPNVYICGNIHVKIEIIK